MVQWDECPEGGSYIDDDGIEHTITCDKKLHSEPGDETAWHWDDRFGITWRFADSE